MSKEIFPRSIQDIKEDIKIIYHIGYNQLEGMSSFSECEFSKCIITANEEFIQRKHRQSHYIEVAQGGIFGRAIRN